MLMSQCPKIIKFFCKYASVTESHCSFPLVFIRGEFLIPTWSSKEKSVCLSEHVCDREKDKGVRE